MFVGIGIRLSSGETLLQWKNSTGVCWTLYHFNTYFIEIIQYIKLTIDTTELFLNIWANSNILAVVTKSLCIKGYKAHLHNRISSLEPQTF